MGKYSVTLGEYFGFMENTVEVWTNMVVFKDSMVVFLGKMVVVLGNIMVFWFNA